MGAKQSRDERRARAEARRREQQARERRQRRIIFGVSIPVATLVIAAVPVSNWWHNHQVAQTHKVGYVSDPKSAAQSAGCTGVRNDRQLSTATVDTKTNVDYAGLLSKAGQQPPPSSGPSQAEALPDGVNFYSRDQKPRPEQALRNLADGYVVVWYDTALPDDQVNALRTAAELVGGRMIAVPWLGGVFRDGRHVALTAWDRTQRCRSVSQAVLSDFAASYADLPAAQQRWESPSAPFPGTQAPAASGS